MRECTSLQFTSPDLTFYENRLKTFDTWPIQIRPNKFQLSSAGFYYTGRSDIVECFSCAIRLHQWKKEDDPLKEHKSLSPQCLFLKMIGHINSEDKPGVDSPWSWNPQSSTNPLLHFKNGFCD